MTGSCRTQRPSSQPRSGSTAGSGKISTIPASGVIYFRLDCDPHVQKVDWQVQCNRAHSVQLYRARTNVTGSPITLTDATAVDDDRDLHHERPHLHRPSDRSTKPWPRAQCYLAIEAGGAADSPCSSLTPPTAFSGIGAITVTAPRRRHRRLDHRRRILPSTSCNQATAAMLPRSLGRDHADRTRAARRGHHRSRRRLHHRRYLLRAVVRRLAVLLPRHHRGRRRQPRPRSSKPPATGPENERHTASWRNDEARHAMSAPKILMACPTYSGMEYSLKAWADAYQVPDLREQGRAAGRQLRRPRARRQPALHAPHPRPGHPRRLAADALPGLLGHDRAVVADHRRVRPRARLRLHLLGRGRRHRAARRDAEDGRLRA